MIEKIRNSLGFEGEWTFKKIAGAFVFLAIIVVFLGFNTTSNMAGDELGGAAAVVNDVAIPYQAFRGETEQREREMQEHLAGLPEAQRQMYDMIIKQQQKAMRAQVLENLVTAEVIFQTAGAEGVVIPDGQIRDYISSAPALQENGVFQFDRYRMYLQSNGLTASTFERQMRKQLTTQKTYELFLGAAAPASEELKRNRQLASEKVSVRFVELAKEDLAKMVNVSEADVKSFVDAHAAEIETYYKDNKVEFTKAATYHARDLLIRSDEKRKDADAKKLAEEIAGQINAKNFVELVKKHSEDPGSKAKGGDLGERSQGSLPASFETPVLALAKGEVSKPLKIEGGYHIVLLENKSEAGTTPLDAVRNDIARKLLQRAGQDKVLTEMKSVLAKGDRKEIETLVARTGKKWAGPTEFDLSTKTIPKLGDSDDLVNAVIKNGRSGGLVKRLVSANTNNVVVDVLSWKQTPDVTAEAPGIERMVAAKRAEPIFEEWIKGVEKNARIQRNNRLLE